MRISRNFCIACVRAYQLTLSPLLFGLGVQCRFTPGCSEYAKQSFETHGAGKGLLLSLRRLSRCHPFCAGGFDPVPGRAKLVSSGTESFHG
jgi:putative membrane protein insertion efficiency factor